MSHALPPTSGERTKLTILMAACVLGVAIAALLGSGGHFNVDEGVYHMMVRDASVAGNHALWNGYEEFPSRELWFPVLQIHAGRLVSQYPEGFTLLTLPFYRLLGYDGLFVLNALAFFGTVLLTYRLAQRFFPNRHLALNACLVLVFATYAWEYTQASMPHGFSMLIVVGAVCLVVKALDAGTRGLALLAALAGGGLIGAGATVRLDVMFALPLVIVPFIFARPARPWLALSAGLATLPALIWLALINQEKFGVVSPFTYGANIANESASVVPYLMLGAAGFAGLGLLWTATRPWGQRQLRDRPKLVALALAVTAGLVLLFPPGWSLAGRFAEGLYLLVVDLRIRDLSILEGGLTRGPDGSMIYIGSVKKSLLQSCPYLAALILPFWALLRGGRDRPALAMLALGPAVYIGVYSYFAWHGGQGLNLRYFLPILPFTSILTAYAWHDLTEGMEPSPRRRLALLGAGLAALFVLLGAPALLEPARQGVVFLTVPLVLAGGLLAAAIARLAARPRAARITGGVAAAGLTLSLVWAGLVAFTYDLPRAYLFRMHRAELTRSVAPRIEPDSLLFVHSGCPFFGLLEGARLRIATPRYDDFQDFTALAKFHLRAGRPVYAWLDEHLTQDLEDHGLLPRLRLVTLFEEERGQLVRITGIREG